MKILKKLLIIGCFSFLFLISKVNAATNFTSSPITALNNYLSYDNNISDFQELVKNSFDFSSIITNENYYIYFDNGGTSNIIRFYILQSNDNINLSVRNFSSGLNLTLNRPTNNWLMSTCSGSFNSSYDTINISCSNSGSPIWWALNYDTNNAIFLFSNLDYIRFTGSYDFSIDNQNIYSPNSDVPLSYFGGIRYFYQPIDLFASLEPQYTLEQTILDDGRVKLLFNFTNYETNNNYAFTITNKVSGEEYGIANPYVSIFPNIIPFSSSYEIILDYDTIITVSLSQYIPIEGTDLFDREPLYVDSYDINNIVFNNLQNPYFSIIFQNKNNLIGKFNNTKNNNTCYYKFSNSNIENNVSCNETLDLTYNFNGYIEILIKKGNNLLYSRKINLLGGDETQPYIVYSIEKQDFYSRLNWYVENFNSELKFRYSVDNGSNFTSWENLTNNNQFLNIYQNSIVIIDISDNNNNILDSKAINVVVSIENLQNFNNTTNNLIDKFNNIFNVNGNILTNIESSWFTLKTTKLYLIVFIPFITSIICAIIYLIRRK